MRGRFAGVVVGAVIVVAVAIVVSNSVYASKLSSLKATLTARCQDRVATY